MKRSIRGKNFLTTYAAIAVLLSAIMLTAAATVLAEGGSDGEVVIMSPADGATISGSSVDVVFELRDKGSRGDHVHLYLDGKLVKPLHGKKVSHTINGLRGGTHTITVRIATKRHEVLETKASVNVHVK